LARRKAGARRTAWIITAIVSRSSSPVCCRDISWASPIGSPRVDRVTPLRQPYIGIHDMSQLDANVYYVPHSSRWPIIAVIGMFLFMAGAAIWLNGYDGPGQIVLTIGALTIIGMMFGWFSNVIRESMKGIFNGQVDTSFRMGMMWFIVSEVFFFAAFFGGLFYIRTFVVPWLGGMGDKGLLTNGYIWQGFSAAWPTNGPDSVGGSFIATSPWGIPLINTLLLLS